MTALVMELVEREDLSERIAPRCDCTGRRMTDSEADCRGARSRARSRDHSPRSEAREYQSPRRRHSETPGFRIGEGGGACRHVIAESVDVADALDACDAGRHHPRDCGVHVARAGTRQDEHVPIGKRRASTFRTRLIRVVTSRRCCRVCRTLCGPRQPTGLLSVRQPSPNPQSVARAKVGAT